MKELAYRFELQLASSPEELWPLASDTNRFNRDAGVPPVEALGVGRNARRRLRLRRLGVAVEWEEEPFEWVRPERFSVVRRYLRGPVESMVTTATLEPTDGGTRLRYDVRAKPRNLLGRAAIPVQVGLISGRRFESVFREYDRRARHEAASEPAREARLEPGAAARIAAARETLGEGAAPLCDLVEHGDELALAKIRPYALADEWGTDRRETLELCLRATRAGLLELRWELLCPLCRGTAATGNSLGAVAGRVHCETCRIDVTADFERSVEIAFRPAQAVRRLPEADFCVAGPQMTPHVVLQQLVPPGGRREVGVRLGAGRYRLRTLATNGALPVAVAADGAEEAAAELRERGWAPRELRLGENVRLEVANATAEEQLVVLEHTEWIDGAASAAEVTALQAFRDLFAAEALRPGEPISVGALTVVFTDLLGSTGYYREVGDAPAFGSVLAHIDVLRETVAAGEGAVVKAMGDAIMAVFARPAAAVTTMLAAQEAVAGKPLALKVGIHTGPCVAVDQNGILDYFGSTVNLAARLVGLSAGGDVVLSQAVLDDAEVRDLGLRTERVEAEVKGFEGEELALWRVRA
jgi:class 3 adenylate cyclase